MKHRIDEIYTQFPFFGSRRITQLLNQEGVKINRKRVQRHMYEMGIQAIYPGPNVSKRNLQHRIYPYLLKGVNISRPNQVWSIDITYIRLHHSWMYLTAIIDWYSRYIISWELDQTLEMDFVLQTVQQAFTVNTPEIFNSDQGSHFTSPKYYSSFKGTSVHTNQYGRKRTALDNINHYMDFYNHERPHQSLDYQTPASIYFH